MNIVFNVGTVLVPFILLLISFLIMVKVKNRSLGLLLLISALLVFFSLQSYGPRNEVKKAVIPKAPDASLGIPKSDLIPENNRWDKLEKALKENKERQDNES